MKSDTVLTFHIVQPAQIPQLEPVLATALDWDAATFAAIFAEHEDGASTTILAFEGDRVIGSVTIRWHARYPPFRDAGIPLIQHIEIAYHERGRGLGNQLLAQAEDQIAQRSPVAGLCVGIFDAYGRAQRLYAKRGFIPDGRGVCHGHTPLNEGATVTIGHDLLLWLTKDVSGIRQR